jgi:hypothetical protein
MIIIHSIYSIHRQSFFVFRTKQNAPSFQSSTFAGLHQRTTWPIFISDFTWNHKIPFFSKIAGSQVQMFKLELEIDGTIKF